MEKEQDSLIGKGYFDRGFQLLVENGTRLFLPLFEYAFGEKLPEKTTATLLKDRKTRLNSSENKKNGGPHILSKDTGLLETDSIFAIDTGEEKMYKYIILEEQTKKDATIFRRLYEYMLTQSFGMLETAMQNRFLHVPQVAVLNLRGVQQNFHMRLGTDEKHSIDITARAINMRDFKGIEDLNSKGLYCLMPYHMFLFEEKIKRCNKDSESLRIEYINELRQYDNAMITALENGTISPGEMSVIEDIRKKNNNWAGWKKKGFDPMITEEECKMKTVERFELESDKIRREAKEKFELESDKIRREAKEATDKVRKEAKEETEKVRREAREDKLRMLKKMLFNALSTRNKDVVRYTVKQVEDAGKLSTEDSKNLLQQVAKENNFKVPDGLFPPDTYSH